MGFITKIKAIWNQILEKLRGSLFFNNNITVLISIGNFLFYCIFLLFIIFIPVFFLYPFFPELISEADIIGFISVIAVGLFILIPFVEISRILFISKPEIPIINNLNEARKRLDGLNENSNWKERISIINFLENARIYIIPGFNIFDIPPAHKLRISYATSHSETRKYVTSKIRGIVYQLDNIALRLLKTKKSDEFKETSKELSKIIEAIEKNDLSSFKSFPEGEGKFKKVKEFLDYIGSNQAIIAIISLFTLIFLNVLLKLLL